MDRRAFADWIERYEDAWREPGTLALAGLFTTDATYRARPYEPVAEGLAEIEAMWERERKGPDEVFAMRWELVAVEDDTGVVRLEVDYGEPLTQSYRDLWIVRLREDGRCCSFEEWPFRPSEPQDP